MNQAAFSFSTTSVFSMQAEDFSGGGLFLA
jgi:hypothetical protein